MNWIKVSRGSFYWSKCEQSIFSIVIQGKMFPREAPKIDNSLGPHSWKPRDFSIFDKMREQQAIKIGHFSIFNVNFLYQKSAGALWKWFSFFNMWIVEQLLLLTYYHKLQFCKNGPNFWWVRAQWFWKQSLGSH